MPLQVSPTILLAGVLFATGCAQPLGIVRKATDGAEAISTKAEDTVKGVHDQVGAFGGSLKAKVKNLGDDLFTWNADEGAITPTAAVHIDKGPTIR